MKKKSKKQKKKSKSLPKLSFEQVEIVGQMNDYSYENPGITFEEVVRKEFKQNPFPDTLNGKLYKKECRKVFDMERGIMPKRLAG